MRVEESVCNILLERYSAKYRFEYPHIDRFNWSVDDCFLIDGTQNYTSSM